MQLSRTANASSPRRARPCCRCWKAGNTHVMKTLLYASLLSTLVAVTVRAQINAGEMKADPNVPFTMAQVANFKLPWRIAFLPDGRMLVTEKVGPIWLV